MTGLGEELPRSAGAIWRAALPVWAGLMALLAATLVAAYLPLGRFNLVLSLGIAVAKAALVVVFFMQLKRPNPLLRLAAFAGLIFLAFMFTLTYADVLTRAAPTQPGIVMPRSIPDMPATGQRAF
ncbi:cytochrome C oxidase subunit IV family protein [Dankookia sp. P2]|uniref:cytochrome C oxidase subunit IV family protein n=1 Tax=Dankookia sp. P2 TaxID=3423955 RepID=UPI003D66E21A